MRILQVEKYYWPQGGASKYALDLSRLLADAGETVIPFASKHERNLDSVYGDYFVSALDFATINQVSWKEKIRYAGHSIYSLEARKKMASLLDTIQVDVAHLHTIYHQISPSIIPVLKKRGIPMVMTLHDYKLLTPNYTFFHHGANHEEDGKSWYLSCLKNKCFKDSRMLSTLVTVEMVIHHKLKRYYEEGVDIFFAPSLFIKNMFVKFGWDSKKIVQVPLPVRVPDEKNGRPGDYVLYVGRLAEEKGLQFLIEAAFLTPQIPYKIVGDGPFQTKIQSYLLAKNCKNVELFGYKQGKELAEVMANARFVVAPSIWYENYPLSVLEAKAAGKIVVASSIGGLPEMVPPEFLVPPGDALALAEKIEKLFTISDQKILEIGHELREEVIKVNDPHKHRQIILDVYQRLTRR